MAKQSKGAKHDNIPQDRTLSSKSTDSSAPSLPDYIPSPLLSKKLLAFRTITTLLSHVQHQASFTRSKFGSNPAIGPDLQREVLLCDALAHLAIIDHKIIALTTNHRSHSKRSDELSVMASHPPDETHLPDEKVIAPPSTFATIFNKVVKTWHLLFTKNTEKSELKQTQQTQYPSITEVKPPSDYPKGSGDRNLTLYMYLDALEQNWNQPTLESHLWILSELLTVEDPLRHRRLLRYSIATCHPKMITRLRTTRSKMFIQSLKQLPDFLFQSGLVRDRHPHEISNDRTFLESFVKLTIDQSNDIVNISIPNIVALYKGLGPGDNTFELYNSETYMEFHKLLNKLLDSFQTSLESLSASAPPDSPSHPNFIQHLHTIYVIGYALLTIAKGRAFQMYLKNIQPLVAPESTVEEDEGQREDQAEDRGRDIGEDSESDDDREVETVLQYATVEDKQSWSKLCKAWLLLMVVHFEAADALIGFVSSADFRYKAITFKILTSPMVDNTLLPWGELFTNPRLKFPTSDPENPIGPTNDVLYKYLTDASKASRSASSQRGAVDLASTAWKNHEDKAFVDLIKKVQPQTTDVKTLLSQALSITSTSTPESRHKVTEALESFHQDIRDKEKELLLPFNLEAGFGGALHCESFLTIMIYLREKSHMQKYASYDVLFKEMQDYGPGVGVSKYCCLVCWKFISLLFLEKSPNNRFIVRGFHNTITACSLPDCTPEGIVDDMNITFGQFLRNRLVVLQSNPHSHRRRTRSTGSHISIDSTDGQNLVIKLDMSSPLDQPLSVG
ncbi:hypothetical protein CPB84DRAFT_1841014 [Gymnopilus junonius]|uniref:Uncharacterized protein n=1 Tax=Gymnopilus junonius TaxID=109634 RepID=A0A9P5P225_GYMJU|nr:hypothetical protein CPB84DRAFT_1841014 [Gymnopilus junonius]